MCAVQYANGSERSVMGAERKSAVINEKNRRLTAYHEGGHALVALLTPGAHPVHKATIVPRGERAVAYVLGYHACMSVPIYVWLRYSAHREWRWVDAVLGAASGGSCQRWLIN